MSEEGVCVQEVVKIANVKKKAEQEVGVGLKKLAQTENM